MTTANIAPCRLGITAETLSALRDGALTAAQEQELLAHLPTCAACQARLAGLSRVARALHLQRDLEPDHQRIWDTTQSHLRQKEHTFMQPSRQSLLRGTIAVTSVILVVALFAFVSMRHSPNGGSISLATPGQTASPPSKPTPLPSATPISLTGLPTPQQVWGAGAAQATVNIGNLHVDGITPDGQHLLGDQMSPDGKNYDIGWFSVATQTFTTFDQSAVNGPRKTNNPPNCCVSDGRFIVGANGASEGSSGNIPWYYDTQTGQLHAINNNLGIDFFALGIHDGVVYHSGYNATKQAIELDALNLLTGANTVVPGTTALFNLGNFAWPDFTYTSSNDGGHTLYIHNLQTNADVALKSLDNLGPAAQNAALLGDTAFFITTTGTQNTLEEWDSIFTSGSTPVPLTALVGDNNALAGANERVVLIPAADFSCQAGAMTCTYALAWDRALRKLVLLSPSTNTILWLSGDHFVVVNQTANQATLYDASTFPTH